MSLNLFRQDNKKLFLLIAYQQSLSSGRKIANSRHFLTNLGKKLSLLHRWQYRSFVYIFGGLIFFVLTLPTIFVFASFLPKVSKVKEGG
jgi:hypothetical protein